MDTTDYMRGGPMRPRGPGTATAPFRTAGVVAEKPPLCETCRHGMTTRADAEARPVYYCLLAGVEMVRDVQVCSRFATKEGK